MSEFVMILKFSGGHAKLQRCTSRTGLPSMWRELKYGRWRYRTKKGGVLNWWETTGTNMFQGLKDVAREELERAYPREGASSGDIATACCPDDFEACIRMTNLGRQQERLGFACGRVEWRELVRNFPLRIRQT
jgi:hypothetical protein